MREILTSFFDIYTRYSGRGKLLPLFLAAMIILILAGQKEGKKSGSFLFVLSVYTAIAHAFVRAVSFVSSRIGKWMAAVLIGVALILSGTMIYSADFLESGTERSVRENDYTQICETILKKDPHAKVIAAPQMMPFLGAYSADLELLYTPCAAGRTDLLTKEEHYLYDAFSSQHPDFTLVRRLCRGQDPFYAIVDKESMWPERIYESGFDLMTTIDHYDIYVCAGGAHE